MIESKLYKLVFTAVLSVLASREAFVTVEARGQNKLITRYTKPKEQWTFIGALWKRGKEYDSMQIDRWIKTEGKGLLLAGDYDLGIYQLLGRTGHVKRALKLARAFAKRHGMIINRPVHTKVYSW